MIVAHGLVPYVHRQAVAIALRRPGRAGSPCAGRSAVAVRQTAMASRMSSRAAPGRRSTVRLEAVRGQQACGVRRSRRAGASCSAPACRRSCARRRARDGPRRRCAAGGPRPHQRVDLAHLGKQVKGLLVDADAQLPAGALASACVRQARAGRQGVGKTELALPGSSLRASTSQARGGRGDIDEADRHVDGQNGKTLAGFCEGLHDFISKSAVGVAPADHPAGAAAVGAADDQAATTTWPSWP